MAMTYSYDDLINNPVWGANKIKNARNENENTALRVGTFLANLALYAKETLDRTGNTVLADSLRQFFLSKDRDDLTLFNLAIKTLVIGLSARSDGFEEGLHGAGIFRKDGKWIGEFDNLVVHDKIEATTIEIDHEKHVGGKLLNTAANMILVRVTEVTRPMTGTVAYKCYFDSKDKDGRTISNMWAVNDQAIMKQFAIGTGDDEGKTIASRYYWRLVTAVGTETINGVTYNYATLSNVDGNYVGTDVPEVGDEVVQLGNQSDTNRQGAIILAAIGTEGESAPSLIGYNGINTFSLENKEVWKLSPDDTKILADNIFIGDRTVTNAITNLDREIEGITEGEFDVFQDELHGAPKNSSQEVLTFVGPKAYSYLPSYDWETTSYADHTNDILVFKDGITYKFDYVNNVYGWYIVTDSYLIAYIQELTEARQKIGDIVADDRITNDEKNEVQKMYDSIVRQYGEYLTIYNSLVGYQDKVEDWSAYQQAYNALCDNNNSTGFLKWIIDVVSATYTLVLGTGTFSRAQLNAAISTYYEYEAKIKSELESARLLPTGIDIQERKITVTSDTFEVQNNHGDRTLGVDENGDITVVGALNRLVTRITTSNYRQYLIQGVSTESGDSDSYYSLDVLRCGDVIVFESLPNTMNIVLPCAFYGKPSSEPYDATYFMRTKTKFDQDLYNFEHGTSADSHLLTKKELKQLIGKELTIFNDCQGSNQPVLYWGIDAYPDESRYLKNGGQDVQPGFVYSVFNNDIVINPSSSVYPVSTNQVSWNTLAMHLKFMKVQTVGSNEALSEGYVWQRTGYIHGLDLDEWEDE